MQDEKQLEEYLDRYFSLSDRNKAFLQRRFHTVELEIIETCNLRCAYCYPNSSPISKRKIPICKLQEIIGQAAESGVKELVLLGGEPLLHPDWSAAFQHAKQKGIRRNVLYTNGTLLPRNVEDVNNSVDWLRLHLDSSKPKVFATSQGTNTQVHKQVIAGVDSLVNSGFPGKNIELVIPLTKRSYSTLKETIRFAKERWGVEMTTLVTLVDYGGAKNMAQEEKLTKEEYKRAFEIRAEVESRPWLMQLGSSEYPKEYQTTTFMVAVGGDIIPYPTMPIIAGNIRRDNLSDVIAQRYDLLAFRDLLNTNGQKNKLSGECGNCEFSKHCFGTRSMALNNGQGLGYSDPTCWLVNEQPHKQNKSLQVLS